MYENCFSITKSFRSIDLAIVVLHLWDPRPYRRSHSLRGLQGFIINYFNWREKLHDYIINNVFCRTLKRQMNDIQVMHSQVIIIFEVDFIDINHTTRSRFMVLKALATNVKVCNLVNYDHSVNKPCQKCTLKHVHI